MLTREARGVRDRARRDGGRACRSTAARCTSSARSCGRARCCSRTTCACSTPSAWPAASARSRTSTGVKIIRRAPDGGVTEYGFSYGDFVTGTTHEANYAARERRHHRRAGLSGSDAPPPRCSPALVLAAGPQRGDSCSGSKAAASTTATSTNRSGGRATSRSAGRRHSRSKIAVTAHWDDLYYRPQYEAFYTLTADGFNHSATGAWLAHHTHDEAVRRPSSFIDTRPAAARRPVRDHQPCSRAPRGPSVRSPRGDPEHGRGDLRHALRPAGSGTSISQRVYELRRTTG